VFIVRDSDEALEIVREIYLSRKFGNAGDKLLIEEFLEGDEVSFMAITDGTRVVPFAPARDYKKAFEGDEGPNTGGMGSHSPAVVLSTDVAAEIMRTIVIPTVQGMEQEGRLYSGCLFAGLMLTANGPKVLEYNCRFGDPETQVQLLRLEDDLAELCLDVARGNLGDRRLTWKKEAAACVVVAAQEYPGEVRRGLEVTIDPIDDPHTVLFHSGTEMQDGKMVNIAGRVVSACAHAPTLGEAIERAYAAAAKVKFEGARYRTDIGRRSLEVLHQKPEAGV
jgi:phosphoribosylamine--glycine ligase